MTCATIITRSSSTAEPRHGHGRTIGPDSVRKGNARPPMQGHRGWLGAPRAATTTCDAVASAVVHERLREALYLACDRAPEFTPAHRNLIGTQR